MSSKSKFNKNRTKPVNKSSIPQDKINLAVWSACPHVITGFGHIIKEVFSNLYRQHPGVYDISQVSINYHGDYCDEFAITGGEKNGRYRQWTAATRTPNGGTNPFGQTKFLNLIKTLNVDLDAVLLSEDPFWVGGVIPELNNGKSFIDLIRAELINKGIGHVPIITYFPIDGIPKKSWVDNISRSDIPITYLKFGADSCLKLNPNLNGRIGIVPLGVNENEFYPISEDESKFFKRVMFGDRFADKFMLLNVNRNQLRKMHPSGLMAFREFKRHVPNSFVYLNMQPIDVGWNLPEVCNSLGLQVGVDVVFQPEFNVNKGLSVEELNKVFNAADVVYSTAIGGGWELSLTQAFATKTPVVAPANTSHIELCGNQEDPEQRRGMLYKSGSTLSEWVILPNDNEVPRPLPNIEDLVDKLLWVYNNPEESTKMAENGYKWTKEELSWSRNIAPKFHNVFTLAKQIKKERLSKNSVKANDK